MRKTLTISLLVCSVLMLMAEQSGAIPAFARKYRMSCTTCHYPFPRLKAYGDEFMVNGFVLKDEESPRYYVDTGDEHLNLLRDFPIAMRIESYAIADESNDKNLDFRTPYKIKLLSGGTLSKHVSYYMYIYLDERGSVAGLDDAFIMFNNLAGQELDLSVGQFSLSDPMMKSELKLFYEEYKAYKSSIGSSNIKLSYDRGLMAAWDPPTNTGTGLVLMAVNGNGIGAANADHSYDSDKNKVFAGHLSQDITDIANLGVYGLSGKEEGGATPVDNDVNIIGVNLGLGLGPLEINGQWLQRTDTDPAFVGSPPDDIATNGIIAEAIFWPHGDHSKWLAGLLYNKVESDLAAADYETATVHFGYLLKTNVRLGIEGTYDLQNESNIFGIGVNAAF